MKIFRFIFNKEFITFAGVGIFTTILHIVIYYVLTELLKINAIIASIPAFIISMIFSYIANHKWTFQVVKEHVRYFPKYIAVATMGLLLNLLLIFIVVNLLKFSNIIGVLVVVLIVPPFNYIVNKFWTFRVSEKI
ncbi:GtrA family protein [Paenibacillus sp. MSJ-34]|uniref:GtrA family protein n=1 Tax=Paenibacillus sp. MSJ-34 TaxID=2841529 RepID=UPI001C116D1A|nr:GtrA family protein [Paenibacillus sp. MSJ-34]